MYSMSIRLKNKKYCEMLVEKYMKLIPAGFSLRCQSGISERAGLLVFNKDDDTATAASSAKNDNNNNNNDNNESHNHNGESHTNTKTEENAKNNNELPMWINDDGEIVGKKVEMEGDPATLMPCDKCQEEIKNAMNRIARPHHKAAMGDHDDDTGVYGHRANPATLKQTQMNNPYQSVLVSQGNPMHMHAIQQNMYTPMYAAAPQHGHLAMQHHHHQHQTQQQQHQQQQQQLHMHNLHHNPQMQMQHPQMHSAPLQPQQQYYHYGHSTPMYGYPPQQDAPLQHSYSNPNLMQMGGGSGTYTAPHMMQMYPGDANQSSAGLYSTSVSDLFNNNTYMLHQQALSSQPQQQQLPSIQQLPPQMHPRLGNNTAGMSGTGMGAMGGNGSANSVASGSVPLPLGQQQQQQQLLQQRLPSFNQLHQHGGGGGSRYPMAPSGNPGEHHPSQLNNRMQGGYGGPEWNAAETEEQPFFESE
eukprot:comp20485_c0_seq1/m.41334 comp20485_c0_seq1/g.41334  ORF comp20485_c0_seq1/g.41334 comp20485_c0_seq1/m.41334 type:complete len:471 (+) comp20485_c0_seq1:2-1414(+)